MGLTLEGGNVTAMHQSGWGCVSALPKVRLEGIGNRFLTILILLCVRFPLAKPCHALDGEVDGEDKQRNDCQFFQRSCVAILGEQQRQRLVFICFQQFDSRDGDHTVDKEI